MVTGVGFLGAGVILREKGRITGLTTAVTLWAIASVGLAIAYGMYIWLVSGVHRVCFTCSASFPGLE